MQGEPIYYSVGEEGDVPQEDWHPTQTRPIYYTDKKPLSGNEDLLYAQGLLAAGAATLEKKRQDYAGDENIFINFELVGEFLSEVVDMGVAGAHLSFCANIVQKLSRVVNLIGEGKEPSNESIADTCMDAANYFALWAAYIRKERG